MAYQLVDPHGRPLKAAGKDLGKALSEEVATPTLGGVRSILADHPSAGMTPARLAEILLESERGDATRYLELAEDMEEKDLHYRSVLATRKLAVAQLQITVEPPPNPTATEKRAVELVESFLARDELQAELGALLDGLGKGYSVVEMVWDTRRAPFLPLRLEHRDPRWFAFDQRDGRTLRLKGAPGDAADGPADPADEGAALNPGTTALPPLKFIVHVPCIKSGLPIRGGLARAAAWAWLFKNWDLKDWVGFVETYGQPFRLGKYDGNASEEDKRVLLRAVRNISSDAAAIIPRTMEIEFVKGVEKGSGGGETFLQLANFLDQQISKAVLGQTATTDAIAGGHAVGQEHQLVRDDLKMSDAQQLAATLNAAVARPIVDVNLGPQDRYPRVRVGEAEIVDADTFTQSVERVVKLGARVPEGFVLAKLGIPAAGDADRVLGVPASPAAAPGAGAEPDADDAVGTGPGEPDGDEDEDAAHAQGIGGDALDMLLDGLLGGDAWTPLVAPLFDPIVAAIDASATPEELKARLVALIADTDSGRLADALARAGFTAQVMGTAGTDPVTGIPE